MRSTCLLAAGLALSASARVLPETLVLPQCEFYPLREQDRGYLCRYADQPLFVDPDLPEDAPNPAFETRRHRFWGEWFSQADWNECERLGKDFGFDGFAFFPRPHRVRYWDAMEKSPVRDFVEVPIAADYAAGYEDAAKWIGFAAKSTRACRVDGKALILSYRLANRFDPGGLKALLDRVRADFGDTFLFVCDLSRYLANPEVPPEKSRETVRAYLRACDGVIVGDVFSMVAFDGPARNRVFDSKHYEAVAKLLKETVDEPEFRGRKLLGLGACIAHENTTRQFWTASEDGLRTLTESLRIAASAEPDVILLPEWDELNENTCVGPTLMNGFSVKRILNVFQAHLKKRPLKPLAGDDLSKPNLIVSYRRNVSPGERLIVDVLNVPDGSRQGTVSVAVEILDESGARLVSFPAQKGDSSELRHFRFPVDSAALAEKARAPRVRGVWDDGTAKGEVCEGLMPIDLQPANGWCVKEVHQPIRDLAPMREAEIEVCDKRRDAASPKGVSVLEKRRPAASDGLSLKAKIACEEPIRFAFVTGNGDIQRVLGDPSGAAANFIEDESNVVFQVYGIRPEMLDLKRFAYRVTGVTSATWLDRFGAHAGREFRTDWIAAIGDPYFLRIPRAEVGAAKLTVDFGEWFQGEIPLQAAFTEGAYMAGGRNGIQFMVTRFRRQTRYPLAANARELSFDVALDGDRASMSYWVEAVTTSGKTWRSRPFVVEPKSGLAQMKAFSAVDGTLRTVTLPSVRIPLIEYDPNPKTGAYLPTKGRHLHFATVLGGRFSPLTLWNRTSASSMDYPEGLSPDFGKVASAAPRLVKEADGRFSLEFDGDDFISFPWETLPQNAAYALSMKVRPSDISGTFAMLTSKRLLDLAVEDGELVVSAPGVRNVRTGLRLVPDEWQDL